MFDYSKIYTRNNDMNVLLRKADNLKNMMDEFRPLSERQSKDISDYYRIGLTYSSNAIEGNTLTISETKVLLEDGLTVGGKPIRDYYEATGHSNAYDHMLDLAKSGKEITTNNILELHRLFYILMDEQNAGKYRTERVIITGTEYIPTAPECVHEELENALETLNNLKHLHPIEYAALLHKAIVDVHPFIDGNGRTARLTMNLALIKNGYGIAIIPPVLRAEYLDALRVSQIRNPDAVPFVKLIADCVIETSKDYLRLFGVPIKEITERGKRKRNEHEL